jgi:hypothetical protein
VAYLPLVSQFWGYFVDFIRKIREEILNKNQYEMHKNLGFSDTKSYKNFENSARAVNIQKLVKLWRLSGLSGNEIMNMIAEEVEGATKKKRSRKK